MHTLKCTHTTVASNSSIKCSCMIHTYNFDERYIGMQKMHFLSPESYPSMAGQ